MILEIFIALFIGIIAGTFTGLAPGIHINLVAMMLFASSGFFLQFTEPIVLAVFIVSMAIAHAFLDFIPSIFLGAPEESTALSVLPGHSLLLKGRGYEAAKLSVIGSYVGVIMVIVLTPLFILIVPPIYDYSRSFIPLILVLASSFLIFKEKKGRRLAALLIFLLSGILGFFSLDFYMIKEPLFPLLTGLFGTSMLIASISNKTRIPKQTLECDPLETKEISRAVKASIISAPLCSFLPGLGASQAAVIGSSFSKEMNERNFLILIGTIGTLVAGLNFVSLYLIGKGRSGVSVILGKLMEMNFNSMLLLISVMLLAGSVSVILSLYSAKMFSRRISGINYQKLSLIVITFLVVISILISGWFSLIVLVTATSLGMLSNEFGIKKMHLMGCLMIPVILWLVI